VAESARVRVNGHDAATLWCAPFCAEVGRFLRAGENLLEVEVTNVAANRIRDLDRRHVDWKSFYEINFVNRNYRPFDASGWPVRDSGLLGPVTLKPMEPTPVDSLP
jgi:cellulase/cellobiase CelA1